MTMTDKKCQEKSCQEKFAVVIKQHERIFLSIHAPAKASASGLKKDFIFYSPYNLNCGICDIHSKK